MRIPFFIARIIFVTLFGLALFTIDDYATFKDATLTLGVLSLLVLMPLEIIVDATEFTKKVFELRKRRKDDE